MTILFDTDLPENEVFEDLLEEIRNGYYESFDEVLKDTEKDFIFNEDEENRLYSEWLALEERLEAEQEENEAASYEAWLGQKAIEEDYWMDIRRGVA